MAKEMHPLEILEKEHEAILKNIDMLEKIIESAEKGKGPGKGEMEKLRHVAHIFVEAENHHKREEDVLFPAIESKGVQGPTEVMRMEHTELRKTKKELEKTAESAEKMKHGDFVEKLRESGGFIVSVLRDHIYKENNILYNIAREVITDTNEWKNIRKRFDKIGYCCFSPVQKLLSFIPLQKRGIPDHRKRA